ncbi:MAG: hypothetical protein ACM359_00435 [Bacillota bacterium]
MIPSDPKDVQDPASSYERAKPEKESGMGRLDNNPATPEPTPDKMKEAVSNVHPPDRQINAEETTDSRKEVPLTPGEHAQPTPEQPDHSMLDEEPDGWDLAPTDIDDPRRKRHPRTEGKGGVP